MLLYTHSSRGPTIFHREFFALSNYSLSSAAVSFSEDFRAVGHRQTHRGARSHASHLRRFLHRRERSRAQRHYKRALSSWRLPGATPALSDSSASVAAPAVSKAPRSRLGSSDRLTLRDVVRLQLEASPLGGSSARARLAQRRETWRLLAKSLCMSEYLSHDKY